MVEAPKIRLIYDSVCHITNTAIVDIEGTSYRRAGRDLHDYTLQKWWFAGKYLFLSLRLADTECVVRTHFMMFGRLTLQPLERKAFMHITTTRNHDLWWYSAQITFIDTSCESDVGSNYGACPGVAIIANSLRMMALDVSHEAYDRLALIRHVQQEMTLLSPNAVAVDLLLDQKIFPGIGNIVQQEALYTCQINPLRHVTDLSVPDVVCVTDALHTLCLQIYEAIKADAATRMRNLTRIYRHAFCPEGHRTLTRRIGLRQRITTWCPVCQKN